MSSRPVCRQLDLTPRARPALAYLPRSVFVTMMLLALLSGGALAADCIGSPDGKCPIWPTEFDAPFGLHASVPDIKNASSTFRYKFVANGTQAQRVEYDEHCFPFVNARSPFEAKACTLYFVPGGIYLAQPAHDIDCCLFQAGVGAVPPQFLRAYTYKGTNQTAPDMYGNDVSCVRD